VGLARAAFALASWAFLVGVLVQVFLAGAGLFKLTDFTLHTGFGWLLSIAPILLVGLALLARLDRRTTILTLVLMAVAFVQPELVAARDRYPVVAALHPVNALLLFWLAWLVARRSIERPRRGDDPLAARPG
jgi:mercuric ion transport protein